MSTIGYCHDCGAWLQLRDDLTCPNGHPAQRVNGWYDSTTGQQFTPAAAPSTSPASTPVATPLVTPATPTPPASIRPSRSAFLADLMATFSANPAYVAAWGTDTDMTIESNPVHASWGAGKKRVEYAAALKAVEAEGTVYLWEMLKERTTGLSFGSFESETYTTVGAKQSGTKQEAVVGPGSASWEWGYGTQRRLVEEVAGRHGFVVHVVLMRRSAAW
jgi:hypothetical protein